MQIENDLLHYIKSELSEEAPENLSLTDNLLESGLLDSLSIVLLTEYIENQFKVTVDSDDLVPENFETVSSIAELVKKSLP